MGIGYHSNLFFLCKYKIWDGSGVAAIKFKTKQYLFCRNSNQKHCISLCVQMRETLRENLLECCRCALCIKMLTSVGAEILLQARLWYYNSYEASLSIL